MNKQTLIGVVVVGLLAVVGIFAYNRANTDTSEDAMMAESQNQANTRMATEGSEPDSLRALLGLSNTQTCTFADAESNTQGTVYASNGQVRADVTSTTNQETQLTHMITNGTDVFVWMDGENQGFTMNLDTVTQLADRFSDNQETSEGQPSALDPDRQVDFECSPWSVDESMFTPPTSVQFQSFSDLMMGAFQSALPEAMQGDDTPNNCSACDSIPDAAAAEQCKQAFGC